MNRGKGALVSLSEGTEDRTRWVRIAACVLLQTYVRALHAADSVSPRPPAYLRGDWRPPSPSDMEERARNLHRRFPDLPRSAIGESLRKHDGHAGYAAAALARRQEEEQPIAD